jgi:hypothetical protein
MIAFIPKVTCAQCNKPIKDVQRLSDGKNRWIRVRCHGKEVRIGFSSKADDQVTLWQPEMIDSMH